LRAIRIEWIALATVWIGSVILSADVSRSDVAPLELVLGAARGVLGLLICYLYIPRFLQRGRYLAFLASTVGSLLLLGSLEIHVISPLFAGEGAVHNYRCFFICSFPVIASMGMVKLSWLALDQQKRVAIAGRERSESELRFLRAQMNPHLLLNSLNNVYSYALERSERAPEMILKLAGVLRYMLYEASDELVSLRRELDYIRDYFDLQRLAIEGRGTASLEIVGDPARLTIAPLVLIVFVENCFKHAVETTERIFVRASIRIEDGVLLLETHNNLPDPTLQQSTPGGIGLDNVQRRLELLYPDQHALDATKGSESFDLRLKLMLDPQCRSAA
jgi:LytS/YehU family sensor histidine kinase